MTDYEAGTTFLTDFSRAYPISAGPTRLVDRSPVGRYFPPDTIQINPPVWQEQTVEEVTVDQDSSRALDEPILYSRTRFSEDCLEAEVRQGLTQCVILGSGFETFAYRRPDLLTDLQVFELDMPSVQIVKRQRIAAAGLEIPPQLNLLPFDFIRQTLPGVLLASSYHLARPAFFSWFGITYYLSKEMIFSTLADIRSVAEPGSSIVFDYIDRDALACQAALVTNPLLSDSVRTGGQPLRSAFDPESLAAELWLVGMKLEENLPPREIANRYCDTGRELPFPCEHIHFARAVCI